MLFSFHLIRYFIFPKIKNLPKSLSDEEARIRKKNINTPSNLVSTYFLSILLNILLLFKPKLSSKDNSNFHKLVCEHIHFCRKYV